MTTKPSDEIYKDSEEIIVNGPRIAKGGAIAPADVSLIKKVLLTALSDENSTLTADEQSQASHLVHRLGRIS